MIGHVIFRTQVCAALVCSSSLLDIVLSAKMRVVFTACVATAAVAVMPGERDWTSYMYAQYVKDFKKADSNAMSGAGAENFEKNIDFINKHNADPSKTWFATVNEFSDWTNEEFRQRRAHGTRSHAHALSGAAAHEEFASAPDSLDWRKKSGVVTEVKNQGACGSCWAFSTIETLESAVAIATNHSAPVLSPQQVVSCAPNPKKCGGTGGCQGSTQELGFSYTEAGLTTDANYEYTQETGTCDKEKIKPVVKNAGFVRLPTNNYTALINALANVGPIAISVAAGGSGWQTYGGGVYTGNCGFDQDHAVQLVGYGTDSGKDYWIVRNSWAESWGEDGYIRIGRYGEGKEPCGMDTTPGDGSACAGDTKPLKLCGLCGILSDSSYPTGATWVGPAPAPGPAPGPSPGPTPGCADSEDSSYCDYTKSMDDCKFNSRDCRKTCGCCGANPPEYCKDATSDIVV